MNGALFKRCYCRETGEDGTRGRELGKTCPKLWRRPGVHASNHGTWWFQLEVPVPAGGPRIHLRQGGHRERSDAQAALDTVTGLLELAALADQPDQARPVIAHMIRDALTGKGEMPDPEEVRKRLSLGQPVDAVPLLAPLLREWVVGKKTSRKANTYRSYHQHVEQYLIPALGTHRIDRLRVAHAQAMFNDIAERSAMIQEENAARRAVQQAAKAAWYARDYAAAKAARALLATMPPFARPVGASSIQRIRATLRAFLSDMTRQQLVTVNVAKLVEIASGRSPRPMMWTEARVESWNATGTVPSPVMVWTAPQTTAFLARAQAHPLYALYKLIAYCGLRRGEAVGLPWDSVDFATGQIEIHQQIVQLGWDTETTDTKTEAGERTVIAVKPLLTALARRRKTQNEQRLAHGEGWLDTGLVFTDKHGAPLHPDHVTEQFYFLTREAGLPPIKLHGLRHGAATHARAAGVSSKDVSDMLGHSSTVITDNLYGDVVDEAKRAAAEAIADRLAG